ncbi:hypothetical protein MPSEU_000669600 [Mayamaea pseudoterrestris]|nr:hypothetical protein MPSEU_000669600 [Mayamaea pseudoterrestris]
MNSIIKVVNEPLASASGGDAKRIVRVVIRKRQASVKLQQEKQQQVSCDDDDDEPVESTSSSLPSSKLVNYKTRSISERHSTEDRRERRSKICCIHSQQNAPATKQVRFDLSCNKQYVSKFELCEKDIQSAFYSAEEIQRMMRYHKKLASKSSSSSNTSRNHGSDDDLRGLEDYMNDSAVNASNERKTLYVQAVLQEQDKQRRHGFNSPDEIRKQARLASKTSRCMALQLGQLDAQLLLAKQQQQSAVVVANGSSLLQSMRRSSSHPALSSVARGTSFVRGPHLPAIAPLDRTSRRSNSVRLKARAATVIS